MMRMVAMAGGAVAALSLAAPVSAPAPPGHDLYQKHCAVCHGAEARGDGPWADVLAYRPADLTRIAIRARGEFPVGRVRDIIDGRKPMKGRFPSGMPVWGDAFKNAEDGYSESGVREKVSALAEYLRTIQGPAADRRADDKP